MRQIKSSPETQGFVVQDSAEAFMINFVALSLITDQTLQERTTLFLGEVINHDTMPELEQFKGDEATILLTGLKHIATFGEAKNWRTAQARQMLGQYEDPEQRSRDLAFAREMAVVMELEDALKDYEQTGRPL
jgi:hypothetical protein